MNSDPIEGKEAGDDRSGREDDDPVTMPRADDEDALREMVGRRYGQRVDLVTRGVNAACHGSSNADAIAGPDPVARELYDAARAEGMLEDELLASFGCENPTALAELVPGETVLDLGSSGGVDVLLAAKRVGPTGKAYGLDMTDEMLAVATRMGARTGVANAAFLRGHVAAIPLPASSVDVITSNCVINLSPDKEGVLAEAFRVLRPGGRLAVCDVVVRRELPPALRRSMERWASEIAGAMLESEYIDRLRAAGFADVRVESTRIFTRDDAAEMASSGCTADERSALEQLEGVVMTAFIRATKPRAS